MSSSERVLAKDICAGDVILVDGNRKLAISQILRCVALDTCLIFKIKSLEYGSLHIDYYDTIKRVKPDQLPY